MNRNIHDCERPETDSSLFTSTRNVLSFLQRSLRDENERLEKVQKRKIEVMC